MINTLIFKENVNIIILQSLREKLKIAITFRTVGIQLDHYYGIEDLYESKIPAHYC